MIRKAELGTGGTSSSSFRGCVTGHLLCWVMRTTSNRSEDYYNAKTSNTARSCPASVCLATAAHITAWQ
eukprot:125419-Pleurochrysis_carterae.AAC.2